MYLATMHSRIKKVPQSASKKSDLACMPDPYETRTHDLRGMTKEALHGLAWTTDQIESRTPGDWLLIHGSRPTLSYSCIVYYR